ncbi:hypothetical protein AIOL_000926 [Candidatus Rhodobacter oscarellae]|uniref:Uncharacterized protein n=1 Tax=Candidatus Rhodobacter oscarellae TaxID=1675527 RepID=A0A0J9EDR7_9RHOB|nr:hypothetical protein [Candidatus Rhodobacter lobularis]KMW60761.1 hypothetical protein AIOL_000926 [Candidatus Rhodobacter lobularis]
MMAFPENVQELVSVAATYALDGAPFTAADQLHKAADALKMNAIAAGYPIPTAMQTKLKPLDADLTHLLETLEMDEEVNADFDCGDGEMSLEASRLVATARRLAREAGYALPETVGGAS